MSRLSLGLAVFTIMGIVAPHLQAQSSCACPPKVPPSCSAPSCEAPTYQGCAEVSGCTTCATGPSGKGLLSSKCCRPLIHIDLSKNIVKKNGRAGGFFGSPPPTGFAAPSMAVLPLNISTVPISYGQNQAVDSQAFAAGMAMGLRAANPQGHPQHAAAQGANDLECADPCGQIKQVEMDVRELKDQIIMLTAAVDKLARNNAPAPVPAPAPPAE